MPAPVRGPARLPLRYISREGRNGSQLYTFVKKAYLWSMAEAEASSALDKRGSERADSVLIGEPNGKGGAADAAAPPFPGVPNRIYTRPAALKVSISHSVGGGQLCFAQASEGEPLARNPSPLRGSLHTDLCFLAQSGGDLMPPHHRESHPAGNTYPHQGTYLKSRSVRVTLQCPYAAFRLDCNR
jgi:hypothetical protein